MSRLINEDNSIDVYIGTKGLFYDNDGKTLSYLNSVNPTDITELESEMKKRKNTQIILGKRYDCYPSLEEELRVTRRVLELVQKYKLGLTIFTSSSLILNDLDLIKAIAINSKVKIIVRLSSKGIYSKKLFNEDFDEMEKLIDILSKMDISLGIEATPLLPFVLDDIENIKSIIELALKYKPKYFMVSGLSVIIGNKSKDRLYTFLDENVFGLRSKYEALRKESYVIESPKRQIIENYVNEMLSDSGIIFDRNAVNKMIYSFERKQKQLSLFD